MRILLTISLLALVAAPILFAQEQSDKPKYELLFCGEYHGDEVTAVTGDKWWGLFRTDAGHELRQVEVSVENVHDPIADDDESEQTGKKVSVKGAEIEPLFLVKGPAFKAKRPVPTCFEGEIPLEPTRTGRYFEFTFGSEQPTVRFTPQGEAIEDGWQDYEIEIWTSKDDVAGDWQPFVQRESAFPDAIPTLHWAGDIDGDGKMDLLMDMTDHYNVRDMTLFLSTEAGADQPPKPCAAFRTVGC